MRSRVPPHTRVCHRCDGDPKRKNRAFVLNPDLKLAAYAATEVGKGPVSNPALSRARASLAGGQVGPVGVLSMLSNFYPALNEAKTVEFQGPVERRRRPMPADMAQVLGAIPSEEACDVALAALQKGKHVKIEYKVNAVTITVTDRSGRSRVSRLKWD